MNNITHIIYHYPEGFYIEDQAEDFHVENSDLELSSPAKLSTFGKAIAVSCNIAGLVVGSYFKSALYVHMYRNSKEIFHKPIDLLILIQAILEHLICLMMVSFYTIGLTFNITYSEQLGVGWCYIHFYVSLFGLAYRNFGSLSLAILRVFYIKLPYQAKNDKLRRRLLIGTIIQCFVGSIFSSIAFGAGNGPQSRKQVMWNFCVGQSAAMREIINEYSLTLGSISNQPEVFPKLIVAMIFLGLSIEISCYVIIFHTIYTHDENMLKLKRIQTGELRRRHRRNAITFLGQFYSFMVEGGITVILAYTMTDQSDISFRLFIVIYRWVEFGTLSVVEVMSSHSLIDNLPHRLLFR